MNKKREKYLTSEQRYRQILRLILFSVVALTAFAIAPNASTSTILKPVICILGCSFIITLWGSETLKQNEIKFSFSPAALAFLIYIIASALSLFSAYNINIGLESEIELICLGILFFVSSSVINDDREIRKAVNVIIGVSIVCSIIALIQLFQLIPSVIFLSNTQHEPLSTFGNTSYFAGFLILALPVIISRAMSEQRGSFSQTFLFVLGALILYLLIQTQSRSAWAGLIVSAFVFGLLTVRSAKGKIVAVAGIIFLAVCIALFFPDIIRSRLTGLFEMNPSSSISRRLFFYEGAWKAFLASPLTGNGIGNFILFLPKFRSPEYWMFRSEDIVPHAHNEYLEILSETGLAGIIPYIILLVLIAVAIRTSYKHSSGNQRIIITGLTCGLIAVMIDNLASINLRTIPVAICFWVVAGALASTANSPVRRLSIALPSVTKKFWVAPYILLAGFLAYYLPFSIRQYEAETSFLEGSLFNYQNDVSSASDKFNEALARNPNHPLSRFYAAANLIKENRYDEAKRHLTLLLKDYPYYPKARLMSALCSFELGDTSTAITDLRNVLTTDSDPQTFFIASYFAYKMNHPREELQAIQSLLEQSVKSKIPDYASESIGRLAALWDPQSFQTSYSELIQRLELAFPNDISILTAIAECYDVFNMQKETLEVVKKIYALNPTDQAVIQQLRTLEEKYSVRVTTK